MRTAADVVVGLRPVLPEDLEAHFTQQRDPASARMAAVPSRDRADFDRHWDHILADPDVVARTVVADGEVAGSAVCFVRDGQRQVGYWIARERWGQGIASAALRQLLDEVGERPLHARVAAHNAGSLRVLERCGFARVGEERDGDVAVHVLRLGD